MHSAPNLPQQLRVSRLVKDAQGAYTEQWTAIPLVDPASLPAEVADVLKTLTFKTLQVTDMLLPWLSKAVWQSMHGAGAVSSSFACTMNSMLNTA